MKRFCLVWVCFFGLHTAVGQTNELGTWNSLNIKYNYSDTLSFFAEAQLRSLAFYDQFHYYEYKAAVNYKLHNAVRLTLGAGSYQTYKSGGNFSTPKNNNEFRLWPQLSLLQSIGSIKVEQRYRSEFRWTSDGFRNRFRYRLGLVYPFGKETKGYKPFQLNLSNELFFTDTQPYFERNRLQLTASYFLSKQASYQLGFLRQFDYKINDETGKDFVVIGYYFEIFRNNSTKSVEVDQNMKDN
jgi:hypothetical protein